MNPTKLRPTIEVLVGLAVLAVLCSLLWLLGVGALSIFQLNAFKDEPLVVLFYGVVAFLVLFGGMFLLFKVASVVGFVTLVVIREAFSTLRSNNGSDSKAR